VVLFVAQSAMAQLGFCPGEKGAPIFEEDFGSGPNVGPPLPAGTTTYNYIAGFPNDGEYTVANNFNFIADWHDTGDHTGNTNGYALLVNADFTPG
jgi:hypothetical protein